MEITHDHISTFIVGDHEKLGHGRKTYHFISTNYPLDAIIEAYEKASISYGLGLSHECGESNLITFTDRFRDNLIKMFDKKFPDYIANAKLHKEGNVHYSCKSSYTFVELYLMIASLELPGLQWNDEKDEMPTVDIGGYGLFRETIR